LFGGGSGTLCASKRINFLAISGSLFKPVLFPRESWKFSLFAIAAKVGLASSPFILNQFSEFLVILPLCIRRTAELKFDDGIVRSALTATGLGSRGREYAIQSSDMFQFGLSTLDAALGLRQSRSCPSVSRGLTARCRGLASTRALSGRALSGRALSCRALIRSGKHSDLPRLKLPRGAVSSISDFTLLRFLGVRGLSQKDSSARSKRLAGLSRNVARADMLLRRGERGDRDRGERLPKRPLSPRGDALRGVAFGVLGRGAALSWRNQSCDSRNVSVAKAEGTTPVLYLLGTVFSSFGDVWVTKPPRRKSTPDLSICCQSPRPCAWPIRDPRQILSMASNTLQT